MGNQKSSPAIKQSGDGDLTIINNQELHTEFHIGHDEKLLIIIILVSIQLVVMLYKLISKRERRRAANRIAKSMANLTEVTVQKD
ncbi:hypothetical protein RP20_CCG006367 [Aedes albopictus]|nr:hypothetical protein RP20_CCG004405 [Aedes albopictus]KXJ62366.1 hypothetical protein RP20_CCG017688 [Aedes albopictus]KXJ68034.1 hypothetical protein RP20_CCG006367 [Aedes albopictus]